MTTEESLNQINTIPWILDDTNTANLYITFEPLHAPTNPLTIHCWLTRRPHYCDRGHLKLNIEAPSLFFDNADSFPRYFFTFNEADTHTRAFLRWRLHRVRTFTRDQIFAGSPWNIPDIS